MGSDTGPGGDDDVGAQTLEAGGVGAGEGSGAGAVGDCVAAARLHPPAIAGSSSTRPLASTHNARVGHFTHAGYTDTHRGLYFRG